MIVEVLIFIVTFAVVYIVVTRWKALQLRKHLGYRGPPAKLIIGNLGDIVKTAGKNNGDASSLHVKWRKEYGDVYGIFIGSDLEIVLWDLDTAKEVLIKRFDCFTDRMHFVLTHDNIGSQGLIQAKGEQWKKIRGLLTPIFTTGKLKLLSDLMSEKADVFVDKIEQYCAKEQSFDIYNDFQALTLDVIGKAAFALDSQCQTNPKDGFFLKVQDFFREADITKSPLLMMAILFTELDRVLSPFRNLTMFGKHEEWLINGLKTVLEKRKKMFDTFNGVDIMQLLLLQRKEHSDECEREKTGVPVSEAFKKKIELTDHEILANCFVFLLAGYETTSTALGFTAWLLAKHTDVQKRLQEEIDSTLGSKTEGSISYEDVHRMPYMDAVFKESLRLYPPVANFVIRTCVKPCVINGNTFVPGMKVNVPTFNIHHAPDIWEDPERFDPERFLGPTTHHPMAWLPFGDGPRNCIGLRFADMEFKIALCKVLRRFNLEFGPESQDPLPILGTGVLIRPTPETGVTLKATRRTEV